MFNNFIEITAKDDFLKAIERREEEGKLEILKKQDGNVYNMTTYLTLTLLSGFSFVSSSL